MNHAWPAAIVSALLAAAPARQDGDIGVWIGQLASDDIATRETAASRLAGLGISALERLHSESRSKDAEINSRVDGILQVIVRRHVQSCGDPRRPAPVTLDLKGMTVKEAAEAFRKQVALAIEVDDRNIPDDTRLDEFRVTQKPFREALDAFLEHAQLRVRREDFDGFQVERPPRLLFHFKDVNVSVVLDMIKRVTGVRLVIPDENLGTITVDCENEAWDVLLDRIAAQIGRMAVAGSEGRMTLPRLEEFRKQAETKSFPLRHLRPELPAAGKADPFAELLVKLGFQLTRGASWKTVHGRVEYDARTRSIKVTDRKEVFQGLQEIVERMDRPAGK